MPGTDEPHQARKPRCLAPMSRTIPGRSFGVTMHALGKCILPPIPNRRLVTVTKAAPCTFFMIGPLAPIEGRLAKYLHCPRANSSYLKPILVLAVKWRVVSVKKR